MNRLALALLSLLLIAATPLPGTPPAPEQSASPTQQDRQNTQQMLVPAIPEHIKPVSATPNRNYGKQNSENDAGSGFWLWLWTLQGLSTLAVAFFTFLLWCVSRKQWRAISGQADIANKALVETRRAATAAEANALAAKDAAEATKRSVETGWLAINTSRDLFLQEHRPWIVPTGVIRLGDPPIGIMQDARLPLRVELKNIGKTPAFHLEIFLTWRPAVRNKDPLTSLSQKIEYVGGEYHALPVLAPDAIHEQFVMSRQIDQRTFAVLRAGTNFNIFGHGSHTLAVYGRVDYHGEQRGGYFTHFCLVLVEVGPAPPAKGLNEFNLRLVEPVRFVVAGPYNTYV
jgi:hypothetical protein